MKMISPGVHGILDFLTAFVLIGLPAALGWGLLSGPSMAMMTMGGFTILYSLLTDYRAGIVKRMAFKTHLWLDAVMGCLLAAIPWLFEFAGNFYIAFTIIGIFEVVIAFVTKRQTRGERHTEPGNEPIV